MDGRRKNYRAWDPQQNGHDAISPREALPEDDLVFFLHRSHPAARPHSLPPSITPRNCAANPPSTSP